MGKPTQQTTMNGGYTTSNVTGTQNIGNAIYTTNTTTNQNVIRDVINGNTVYAGQSSYTTGPTDYKLVNQTYATTAGGYSGIGQSLTQKVVAE